MARTVLSAPHVSTSVEAQLTKSFAGAEAIAQRYPRYSDQITAAAKASFLHGGDWAYAAGLVAMLAGAVLVYFCFPSYQRERELLDRYAAEDEAEPVVADDPAALPRAAPDVG